MLDLEFTVIDSFPKALTGLRYVSIKVAEDSSLSFLDNLWNLVSKDLDFQNGAPRLITLLTQMIQSCFVQRTEAQFLK